MFDLIINVLGIIVNTENELIQDSIHKADRILDQNEQQNEEGYRPTRITKFYRYENGGYHVEGQNF